MTDPESFEAAFRAHYAELCEYTLRFVGSRAVAEDLVQEVFARVWQIYATRGITHFDAAYLHVAARNRAISYLRREKVAEAWIARVLREETPSAPSPEDIHQYDELVAAVDRAIAELPERCRLIFTMCRHEHMSYAEISTRLGVSVNTVQSQLWRAAKLLRAKLAPVLMHTVAIGLADGAARRLFG